MRNVDRVKHFHVKGMKSSPDISAQDLISQRSWIALILATSLVMMWSGVAFAKNEANSLKTEPTISMKPEIRKIEKMTIAFVRDKRPIEGCGSAWDRLMAWAKKKKLIDEDTMYLGVAYDHPENTPPEKQRYEACITVPKGTKGEGDVLIKQVAGGNYLVFLHHGPYENLKTTYGHIYRTWAPKAKHKIVYDTALEIYRTPSPETPPEKLLTEICVKLAE